METDVPQTSAERPADRADGNHGFRGHGLLGTLAIVYATAIVFLALADESLGSRALPRTWYTNRLLWYCSAVAGYVAGYYLLRSTPVSRTPWAPSRPGVRFSRAVLYTRDGCHLCDDVRDVLARYRQWLPPVEEVDIDTDPDLVERFGTTIPVVELDGRVRFNGRVNEPLLRRMIEGTPPL